MPEPLNKETAKKTDKIELRVSPEKKQAFVKTCERDGHTTSSVLREFIDSYLNRFAIRQARTTTGVRSLKRPLQILTASVIAIGTIILINRPEEAMATNLYFSLMDKNKDGIVTHEEFMRGKKDKDTAKAQKFFDELDTNSDNIIDNEEANVWSISMTVRVFHDLDTDDDQLISLDEFSNPPVGLAEAYLRGLTSGYAISSGDKPGTWNRDNGFPREAAARAGLLFDRFDLDSDRYLSFDEFMSGPKK